VEPKNGQDMNTSRDQITTALDEAEDLTLFADEAFDTDDVDLFEFTGEEDSPLTRLKSIILSLDWEITDEILQELADELAELQKVWEGDKVARVYLQGLDKIGRYLRSQGAYAHPNAIKLLLTFYYNFEKIISSPDITGDTIAALLKGDVRKFKILQYQISQTAPPPETEGAGETAAGAEIALPVDSDNPLQLLKASILGLEWEVTDEGLGEFGQRVNGVEETCGDNRAAQVLIQGLKALGAYITEEKGDAHPEAFTLLHSFYDGLETLLGNGELDDDQRQELLIDRVGRLNALKAAIARAAATASTADEVVEEILQPVEDEETPSMPAAEEEEISLDLAGEPGLAESDGADAGTVAAMETAESPYPEDVLDPSAIQPVTDEIADDFIEEELSIGTEITPALAGSDEETGFDEELAIASLDASPVEEIEEQLDLLFPDSDRQETGPESEATEEAGEGELSFTDDEMFAGLDDILSDDTQESGKETGTSPAAGEDELPPALADSDEEGGFSEDATVADLDDSPVEDLEKKLDSFFGGSEPLEEDLPAAGSDDQPAPALADAAGEEEEALPAAEEESPEIAPALADAPDEGGFNEDLVAGTIDDAASLDIDRKLDSFFGESDEETAFEESDIDLTDSLEATAEEEETIAPALADSDEEGGFSEDATVADLDDSPVEDLEKKLDSFFGGSEPLEEDLPAAGSDDQPAPALADTAGEEEEALPAAEEESPEIAPALADAPDEGGFNEDLVAGTIDDAASLDIDSKLDSFFGEGEEEPGPEEDHGREPAASPEAAETTEETIVPALAEATGAEEPDREEAAEEIADAAAMNIEARLDAFFGDGSADLYPLPAVGSASEVPGAEMAAAPVAAGIDGPAEALFHSQEAAAATTVATAAAVTGLVAGVARLAAAASPDALAEITSRVDALDRETMAPQQAVQLQLLDTALDMLSRLPQAPGKESLDILELLARGVEERDQDPARLVESVARFTAWQRQIMTELLEQQPAADRKEPPELASVSEEIRSAFTELRSSLAEELESLRRELRQQQETTAPGNP